MEWYEGRKDNFGVGGPPKNFSIHACWTLLASPALTSDVLDHADYPITAKDVGLEENNDNVRLFNWIVAAHRLIEAAPQCFEDSVFASELIGTHTGEDWHRAFQLMNHYHSVTTKASAKDGRNTRSRNKTNRAATSIVYRPRGGNLPIPPSGDGGGGQAVPQSMSSKYGFALDDDNWKSDSEDGMSSDDEDGYRRRNDRGSRSLAELEADVEKFIGNDDDLEGTCMGSRNPVDAGIMKQYCSIQIDRVHVLHNLGFANPRHGRLATALHQAHEVQTAAELMAEAQNDGTEHDPRDALLDAEARAQEILEMKQRHSFENSRPRNVAEAADALGLDFDTLHLEGTSFSFMPWQVLGNISALSKDLNV